MTTLIDLNTLITPTTADEYEAKMLQVAATLDMTTTAWQSGGVGRTLFKTCSEVLASKDAVQVDVITRAGYLDLAADPAVTPEPVIGVAYLGGWLDLIAYYEFNVQRQLSTYSNGTVVITNSTGSTFSYPAGTYHIQCPSTNSTFSNTQDLVISPSTTTSENFTCDQLGSLGNAGIGTITTTVTSLAGVSVTNTTVFLARDTESNKDLVVRCRAKLASLAIGGPPGAYDYFARTIPLPADDPGVHVKSGSKTTPDNPVTRTLISHTAGIVNVIVASATGPIPGTVGVDGDDLDLVDRAIKANATPLGITETTVSAIGSNITHQLDVYVPVAYADNLAARIATSIDTYLATVTIGGVTIVGQPPNQIFRSQLDYAVRLAEAKILDVVWTLPAGDTTIAYNAVALRYPTNSTAWALACVIHAV